MVFAMVRPETPSTYVAAMSAQLQDGTRRSHTLLLLREIADLRLQVQTLSDALAALASYQDIAPLLRPPAPDAAELRLPRHVHLDASQHLQLIDGFYGLEYTDRGLPYRWTGPRLRFRFNVWIDRAAAVDVALSVIACGNPGNARGTHLFVDSVRYPVRYDEARAVFLATGILPRRFHGISVFEFELAGPVEDGDPNDLRVLGVPFCAFEATCHTPPAAPADG